MNSLQAATASVTLSFDKTYCMLFVQHTMSESTILAKLKRDIVALTRNGTAYFLVPVLVIALCIALALTAASAASSEASTAAVSSSWIGVAAIILFMIIVVRHTADPILPDSYAKDDDPVPTDTGPATVPEITRGNQVFNIPENTFTYTDAKAVCAAFGSRLATYDEVEAAYDEGGEWCNYGWSANQMALFPTQKATWDKLQTIKGHENDCGRPGVNGGFIGNKKAPFGVNCFGHKPRMTALEQTLMASQPPYPKSAEDIAIDKRVDYWREKLSEVLVSPFSSNIWSAV